MIRALAVVAVALAARELTAEGADPPAPARRVLIISTFGYRFAPWDAFTSSIRSEIGRGWPGPVEFLEAPLELARFSQPSEDGPFATYLDALIAPRRVDLVIAVGAPAASFVARHREDLFRVVPVLVTGLDVRRVRELALTPNQIVVPIHLDPEGVVDNILRVLPDTSRIAVVLGDSPLERFWRALLEREFAPFAGRIAFDWLNRLSLPEMRRAVASLPAHSAVLYGTLNVDVAGVAHEEHEGLAAIRSSSAAPVFGAFESQLGRGIVGGPLVPIDQEAKRGAAVAFRLLRGEAPADIPVPPPLAARDMFDWRELRRWRIPESRLPAHSEVLFRPPSLWEAYRRPALTAVAVVLIEAALIAALLAQRARRRLAEARIHALTRRLITAQEDERKAIARELHDDLSQRLARLSIDAAQLQKAPDPAAAGEMRGELTRLSEDVHSLAYQLHPSTLDDLGLTEALRIECDRISSLESLPVRLQAPDPPPELSRDGALGLFRIAQEGLRNVARHARAKSVDLSLEETDGGARLTIRDDGAGFDPAGVRSRPGLGLASMRERVELLGGRIDIHSAPGRGTTIDVWAPFETRRA